MEKPLLAPPLTSVLLPILNVVTVPTTVHLHIRWLTKITSWLHCLPKILVVPIITSSVNTQNFQKTNLNMNKNINKITFKDLILLSSQEPELTTEKATTMPTPRSKTHPSEGSGTFVHYELNEKSATSCSQEVLYLC